MVRHSPLRHLPPWVAGLFAAALLYTGSVSFTHCREFPVTEARPPSPTVTLHFVTWKADHPRAWAEAIQWFEQAHPHIRIKREIAPHSSTAYHDVLTQKLRNRDVSLDLFFMDVIWPAEFAAAGWALPLDEYFPRIEREKFLPSTLASGVYGDRIYGVPSRIDSGMLYYRKDLLEKYGFSPPSTWHELVRQAQTILKKERIAHPLLRGYSGQFKQYEGLVCDMLEFVSSHNGSFLTEDGRPLESDGARVHASGAIRPGADHFNDWRPRPALTYQESESLAVFIRGKAVFHRNWPYAWSLANDPRYSKIVRKVGVTTLPRFSGGRSTSALGGWLYGISAYSKHPDEAWAFIEFMTSPEIQKHFAISASLAPSRLAQYGRPAGPPCQPAVQGPTPGFSNCPASTPHARVPDCFAHSPAVFSAACWLFPRRIFQKKPKTPTGRSIGFWPWFVMDEDESFFELSSR